LKKNPIISDFIEKKWGDKSVKDVSTTLQKQKQQHSAQAWPTDRLSPNEVVEPVSELQPHWASLERRVLSRKPRKDGPSGRKNIRKTEEDYWLEAGAYDSSLTEEEHNHEPPSANINSTEPLLSSSSTHAEGLHGNNHHQTILPPPGAKYFVRQTTVLILAGKYEEAREMVEVYKENVLPILRETDGFIKCSFVFDNTAGQVPPLYPLQH
jgi:hypothetical protein